jgi:hypothetical protein
MNKSKEYLVPSMVIDCGIAALDTGKNPYQRDTYYARIQATKEYCDEVITKYEKEMCKKRV